MTDRPAASLVYIGVDGGGSRCRVRVRDDKGRDLSGVDGGSANVYLDFQGAVATVKTTIAAALAEAGLDGGVMPRASLGIGLAGVSSAVVADRVRAAFPEAGQVIVTHDGVTACLGAHAGQNGGLVIAGTGSAAVLRLNGHTSSFGGRGFHLGDDGSGARMGRDLWRKVLRAYDGLEPWTPLLRRLMRQYDDDPVAVIQWARQAASSDFAAFAPDIFAAAQDNDAAALALARASVDAIGELVTALAQRGAPRISLVGGLASVLQSHLDPGVRGMLNPPLADALDGALLLAGAALIQRHS